MAKALRFTEPRKRVYDTLKKAEKPMKAYDVVDVLGNVKSMTVYRALDFLVENGLAHRIESLNAYAACNENHCAHKDSQYFICDDCGSVEELHNHAVKDMLLQTATNHGVSLNQANIELRGICGECGL